MSIKIYVASHLEPTFQLPENYEFILTGKFNKAYGKKYGFFTHDSIEGNISYKNKFYSEMSAIYTIKQMIEHKYIEEDYIGIVHYRRYFIPSKVLELIFRLINKYVRTLNFHDVKKYLLKNDIVENEIIVCEKTNFSMTLYEQYELIHDIKDLDIALDKVLEMYPNYAKVMDDFKNQRFLYCCNMMVAQKDVFLSYCNWLFPLLFSLEKELNIYRKKGYQQRIFGYLSERLFNLWLLKNSDVFTIKELPVIRILNAKN